MIFVHLDSSGVGAKVRSDLLQSTGKGIRSAGEPDDESRYEVLEDNHDGRVGGG